MCPNHWICIIWWMWDTCSCSKLKKTFYYKITSTKHILSWGSFVDVRHIQKQCFNQTGGHVFLILEGVCHLHYLNHQFQNRTTESHATMIWCCHKGVWQLALSVHRVSLFSHDCICQEFSNQDTLHLSHKFSCMSVCC